MAQTTVQFHANYYAEIAKKVAADIPAMILNLVTKTNQKLLQFYAFCCRIAYYHLRRANQFINEITQSPAEHVSTGTCLASLPVIRDICFSVALTT